MDNKKCYFHHPLLKRRNPKFINVLTKNYRSHPEILTIPNQLFYGGVLEAKGNPGMYDNKYTGDKYITPEKHLYFRSDDQSYITNLKKNAT